MKKQPVSPDVLEALASGNIPLANSELGSPYAISGVVVHGNHLGRTLGYPTANIELNENAMRLPANGVYAVMVELRNQLFRGMANIGIRPTIDGTSLTLEVHLIDFSGDLYGQKLKLLFFNRIRDEQRFDTLDDLVRQIHRDKTKALKLLS
jgi:riboflavin kinase/FMN adenylyltransferase